MFITVKGKVFYFLNDNLKGEESNFMCVLNVMVICTMQLIETVHCTEFRVTRG